LGYYFLYGDSMDKTTKTQSAAIEKKRAKLCWRQGDSSKLQWRANKKIALLLKTFLYFYNRTWYYFIIAIWLT